tara:strand:- start:2200 stop:2406 length:207 start_codon:yes stop_codon:yes gene_type:complete
MKPKDIRLGQLLKTEHGLATVMKFFAPACIGCIVVSKESKSYKLPKIGEWIYLRGYDLEKAEIISEGG